MQYNRKPPQPETPTVNTPDLHAWLDSLCHYPGLFMTGTDTGVGKTWVGTQLLQHLRQRQVPVMPCKPVESGWDDAYLIATDAWQLAVQGYGFQSIPQVCPNRLLAPLSPPRAAQLEGKSFSISELAQHCRARVKVGQFLYVEGAGGFYSPLASDGLNADLAQALQLPVVLVSPDRVGCINHILLTVAAIRQRGLILAGIILNPLQAPTVGMDNLVDLGEWLPNTPVLRWM